MASGITTEQFSPLSDTSVCVDWIHQADLDGDGISEHVAFDPIAGELIACRGVTQHRLAWIGGGGYSLVIDIERDGAEEIVFGDDASSTAAGNIARWVDERLVVVTTADGNRLRLQDGFQEDGPPDGEPTAVVTWGCIDIGGNSRELVTGRAESRGGHDWTVVWIGWAFSGVQALLATQEMADIVAANLTPQRLASLGGLDHMCE
ncbi:MAG: hypothetical protein R3249_00380 [Nitriliruptorales bacterium]|nr:hypothetical protein [Nitriliruptorales bacterium]